MMIPLFSFANTILFDVLLRCNRTQHFFCIRPQNRCEEMSSHFPAGQVLNFDFPSAFSFSAQLFGATNFRFGALDFFSWGAKVATLTNWALNKNAGGDSRFRTCPAEKYELIALHFYLVSKILFHLRLYITALGPLQWHYLLTARTMPNE